MSLGVILILVNIRIILKLYIFVFLILIFSYSLVNPKIFERIYNQTFAQINVLIYNINDKDDERITKYIKDKDIANFIATNQHKYHFKTAKDMFLSKPINAMGLKCLERSVKTSI